MAQTLLISAHMAPRSFVCITCRTRLGPGEKCELHEKAAVASLKTKAGRAELRNRVWGSPDARARIVEASKAGVLGGGLGGLEGCLEIGGAIPGAQALALVALLFFGFFIAYLMITSLIDFFRSHRRLVADPAGVSVIAGKSRALPFTGTVTNAHTSVGAPLSDRRCAAWGVLLTRYDAAGSGPVLLRDGYTTGLELTLDDGRVVRIPNGRIRVVGPTGRHPGGAVRHYLTTSNLPADPDADAGQFPLFPAKAASEVLVGVGDRVHFRGDLVPADGIYREVTRFVSRGVVELTLRKDA